jgi:hypothetical protein
VGGGCGGGGGGERGGDRRVHLLTNSLQADGGRERHRAVRQRESARRCASEKGRRIPSEKNPPKIRTDRSCRASGKDATPNNKTHTLMYLPTCDNFCPWGDAAPAGFKPHGVMPRQRKRKTQPLRPVCGKFRVLFGCEFDAGRTRVLRVRITYSGPAMLIVSVPPTHQDLQL